MISVHHSSTRSHHGQKKGLFFFQTVCKHLLSIYCVPDTSCGEYRCKLIRLSLTPLVPTFLWRKQKSLSNQSTCEVISHHDSAMRKIKEQLILFYFLVFSLSTTILCTYKNVNTFSIFVPFLQNGSTLYICFTALSFFNCGFSDILILFIIIIFRYST